MKNITEIEVRYQETDQMGIVYHGNYVVWFEIGRTKLIEELGFKYASMEESGYVSPVTDIQVSYKKPALYGESVFVETSIGEYNGIRTVYAYTVKNVAGDILCTGTSTHVVVRKDNFRPVPVRRVNQEWDEAYKQIVAGDFDGIRN